MSPFATYGQHLYMSKRVCRSFVMCNMISLHLGFRIVILLDHDLSSCIFVSGLRLPHLMIVSVTVLLYRGLCRLHLPLVFDELYRCAHVDVFVFLILVFRSVCLSPLMCVSAAPKRWCFLPYLMCAPSPCSGFRVVMICRVAFLCPVFACPTL